MDAPSFALTKMYPAPLYSLLLEGTQLPPLRCVIVLATNSPSPPQPLCLSTGIAAQPARCLHRISPFLAQNLVHGEVRHPPFPQRVPSQPLSLLLRLLLVSGMLPWEVR